MKSERLLTLAILILLSLTTAVYASSLPMVGSKWEVYNRVITNETVTLSTTHATTIPTGGVQFTFPDATATIPSYTSSLRTSYFANLTTSNTITAVISVIVTRPAAFVGPGGTTTFVRLFFQANLPASKNPSCAGSGYNEYNYWWADPVGVYYFTGSGTAFAVLSVPMNGAGWSDMCGHPGTGSDSAGFNSAIAKITSVGLSFGSGDSYANGVGVDYMTGTADFQLNSYMIS